MKTETEFAVTAPPTARTDWAAIRGEASVYILATMFVGMVIVGLQVIDLLKASNVALDRVEQRMNADSRIIQIAIEKVDPERRQQIEAIEKEYAPH